MKRRSDEPSDGRDRPMATAAPSSSAAGAGSDEPAKKPRTEPSSSSSRAEPPLPQPQPPPQKPSGSLPEAPELGEDLMFEVLRRAEPRTLAAAACVSRRWRRLAEDERLWEAACVREWASLGYSEQQLRAVVPPLGGFRRLHAVYLRPLRRRGGGAPRWGGRRPPPRLGREEAQLSLLLLSIGFFERIKKDPNSGKDRNGGSGCG